MRDLLQVQDFIITPVLLLLLILLAFRTKNKHLEEKPHYHFYVKGLSIKLFMGLLFGAVYMFYYDGGDTQYYYTGARSIWRMLFVEPSVFLKLMLGDRGPELWSHFNMHTGWPTYFKDTNAWAVCRFSVPFYIFGFGSFFGTTLVMNFFMYKIIWKFYELLIQFYPEKWKTLGYIMFFMPSVAFWGSGLLKDIFTYSAGLFFYVLFHRIISERKYSIKNILLLIFWVYIIIAIRPFIFYILGASSLLWFGFNQLKRMPNIFIRTVAMPIVFTLLWVIGTLIFARLGSAVGERYGTVDAMLEHAVVVQDDLTREYYGENSFDIGDFDASILGIMKKAPQAIAFGLFRPYIWEARSPLMIMSGLENFLLIILTIYFLWQHRIFGFFKELIKDPFLLGLFVFAISFIFMVGLTTANFGALVRYRIPSLPLFLIVLLITQKRETQKMPDL